MKLPTMDTQNLAPTVKQLSLWSERQRAPDMTHDSPELLQCTPREANVEVADSRYWTTYDHYMIERQARALRREYVYRPTANGRSPLRQRVTASSPASTGAAHP